MTGTQVFNYPGGSPYETIDTDLVNGVKVQRIRQRGPAISTITIVTYLTSNKTFLAANVNRLGATIYNNCNVEIFLVLGPGPAASGYTLTMAPNSYYEIPFGYTGIIAGQWNGGGAGNAHVTELT